MSDSKCMHPRQWYLSGVLKCAAPGCPEGFESKDKLLPEMYESDGRRFSRDIVVINDVAHHQWLVRQREKDELDHAEQQRLKGITAALEGRRAVQLQKELAAEKAAHEMTHVMLRDLALERLPEWLAETVANRVDLISTLKSAASNAGGGYDCESCCEGADPYHDSRCEYGLWLRRIGGEVETQRQAEAAFEMWEHEEDMKRQQAARDAEYAANPRSPAAFDTALMAGLFREAYAPAAIEAYGFLRQLSERAPACVSCGEVGLHRADCISITTPAT